jgi:hypothetical protein
MKLNKIIHGTMCSIVDSTMDDCSQMLKLRKDPSLSKYLKNVDNDLLEQQNWLNSQYSSTDRMALTIKDSNQTVVGFFTSFRIFWDFWTFEPGGWIMENNLSPSLKLCSLIVAYEFGFNEVNQNFARLIVRHGNKKVLGLHEKMGSINFYEDKKYKYFILSKKNFNSSQLRRFYIK